MTVTYHTDPFPPNAQLSSLMTAAWGQEMTRDYVPILQCSLCHICVKSGEQLIGFVNVAWDGGTHAFILDTTVHPDWQRQGIATELVKSATKVAREKGAEWLHVDFEPHLAKFYENCGFEPSDAGILNLAKPMT